MNQQTKRSLQGILSELLTMLFNRILYVCCQIFIQNGISGHALLRETHSSTYR